MAMSVIWTAMVVLSLVCAAATGRLDALAASVLEGAGAAVELCIATAGALCLWSGVLEVMLRAGLMEGLARLLRPVLGLLFPAFRRDGSVMEPLAANVSANLLGLGNAATPMGIRAARAMHRGGDAASDELCLLVVCNSASIQLIPATVAGIRAAAGARAPFDILPAVWLASAVSVTAGILAAKLLARLGRRR